MASDFGSSMHVGLTTSKGSPDKCPIPPGVRGRYSYSGCISIALGMIL